MNIKLELRCHRSSDWPCMRVLIGQHVLVEKKTSQEYETLDFNIDAVPGPQHFVIEHFDKLGSDTWCDDKGTITADRAIEILALTVDGFVVPKNVLFAQKFYPVWPDHFDNPPPWITDNNWLGFNGQWHFDFAWPFDQTYYGYYWQMEQEANEKFTKTDQATKEDYFEAYGLKIKVDENFEYTLTDLKNMIQANE